MVYTKHTNRKFRKCSYWIKLLIRLVAVAPREISGHFDDFKLPSDYEKLDAPSGHTGALAEIPLEVILMVQIRDVTLVDDVNNELSMDLSIQRTWTEHRVEVADTLEEGEWHVVAMADARKFWTPDMYVVGLTQLKKQRGISELTRFLLRKDKTVSQIMQVEMIVKCKFDFRLYPMDIQECKMDFMAPMDPIDQLYMVWSNSTIVPSVQFYNENGKDRLTVTKFDFDITICNKNFTTRMQWGDVSSLRFWLTLHRKVMPYVLETYVPTTMFVVMSWGSFLVKPDIVPGRMVLLVTNLLSLITLFEATRSSSPPGTGVNSLDTWVLACITFVFLALLEYAIVLYQMHGKCPTNDRNLSTRLGLFNTVYPLERNKPDDKEKNEINLRRKVCTFLNYVHTKLSRCIFCKTSHSTWHIMDQVSIVLFPMSFLLYVCSYWTYFVNQRQISVTCL